MYLHKSQLKIYVQVFLLFIVYNRKAVNFSAFTSASEAGIVKQIESVWKQFNNLLPVDNRVNIVWNFRKLTLFRTYNFISSANTTFIFSWLNHSSIIKVDWLTDESWQLIQLVNYVAFVCSMLILSLFCLRISGKLVVKSCAMLADGITHHVLIFGSTGLLTYCQIYLYPGGWIELKGFYFVLI